MQHKLLMLDAETYYDDRYSLRQMPTPNYILDERFEFQMCAVREDDKPGYIVDGPDFGKFLKQFDPEHTTTVTFNALFDNSIFSYRYGFVPIRMLDGLGMARYALGHKLNSFSLANVARHLKLGEKGDALIRVKGMRREQIIAAGLWPEFCKYAMQDADLLWAIFFALYDRFPATERRLMDLVLRCAVEPAFSIDTTLLEAHLQEVREHKNDLLQACGVSVDDLMSTDKFKDALEARGVVVEYKTSPTGKSIPAFAKTDMFMATLAEHDDPIVQALASARLGHKSTLEETRTEKLLTIARLNWPPHLGNLPVPLRYGGAHTQRLSGDWGMNMQNLPSSRKEGSKLRKSILAPPGQKVVTADLGQIEARLTAWFCGATELMRQFREKLDPYALMGGTIFGYEVDRKVQKVEGFIGKTAILGLGYGCGFSKFYTMCKTMARVMGIELGDLFDLPMAEKAVAAYRRQHWQIPAMWRKLDQVLVTAWLGKGGPVTIGPITISYGKVEGPNGLCMFYEDPRQDENGELIYNFGRYVHKMYGAKMLENIVQFLARIVVMEAGLRLDLVGFRFRLQAHDELVFIVKDNALDDAKKLIHTEMVKNPVWAPDIPLTADVNHGQSYGEAK